MGAHDCYHTIHAKDEAEATSKARAHQVAEQHENGHGAYTGHLGTAGIGVQKGAETFATMAEAHEWALDHHDKWDVPYLLKVGVGDEWLLVGWCSS